MTIEEKFFKTFEIKPKYMYEVTDTFYTNNSHTYTVTKSTLIKHLYSSRYKVTLVHKSYPEITDRILLELICILGTMHLNIILNGTTINQLKDYILNECIENRKYISEQVQNLFEVEE